MTCASQGFFLLIGGFPEGNSGNFYLDFKRPTAVLMSAHMSHDSKRAGWQQRHQEANQQFEVMTNVSVQ